MEWLAKMNAPTQSEQVDETCGSGRVVLYLESPDMAVFFEIIPPKRIWDAQIQTSSNRSRKRKNQAIRTQMSHLSFLLKFSSIWHGVRFFNVRCGRLVLYLSFKMVSFSSTQSMKDPEISTVSGYFILEMIANDLSRRQAGQQDKLKSCLGQLFKRIWVRQH